MSLRYNLFKVGVGFLLGTPLLYVIKPLDVVVVSVIQLAFFTLLYAGIDTVYKKWKEGVK